MKQEAPDVAATTFGSVAVGLGYRRVRRARTWYRDGDGVIGVLNLQRSQFGPQYYVNVAICICGSNPPEYPPEYRCHIRTRLDMLDATAEAQLPTLLNLGISIEPAARAAQLTTVLDSALRSKLPALTLSELRTGSAEAFLNACLITDQGWQLLHS